MKKIPVAVLILISIHAQGQLRDADDRQSVFPDYLKFKEHHAIYTRNIPVLTTFPGSETQSGFTYWQGSTYTSFSEDGRFQSTHVFDVQGQLRESRASISFRRKGVFSNFRIQISPQRRRPLFVYTIQ